ncbi:hypothetical protein U9M48_040465 [Paspalum notatum var. saurae]|uniref:F-box domain-containing protein n=1 Tax=Paspalum notatum var. saurae TaxID=547442 RepID=A0AAQ3ULU3_PASNO
MPPKAKATKRWVPASRQPGEVSSSRGRGGNPAGDRLSALPDALLHHIMSFMKAWDAVRTCVLSRRWRDLWASAPCVDIRVGRYSCAPDDFAKFVYRLLLAREALAPVDTLRLRSPGEYDDGFDDRDVKMWIRHAIRLNARVIQLTGHHLSFAKLNLFDFVSRRLKILRLSYADVLGCFFGGELSSHCPSLEELELKNCFVGWYKIVSVSLKRLTLVKCTFSINFSVDAPNLVFLRCVAPESWVPLFKNFGELVTGSVMIDDYSLGQRFEKYQEDDEFSQTSDDDDENNSMYARGILASDNSDQFISDDSDFTDDYYDEFSDDIEDDYDYGSDIDSDSDTYVYTEIENGYENKQFGNSDDGHDCTNGSKYHGCSAKHVVNDYKNLGGQNVLHSLSSARSLELLGHSGEVVLRRELMNCPTFNNLKTLAIGEWCISAGADFDILILLLQHSPCLEKLYVQLEMNSDIQKALGRGTKPKGGSFACKHLSMVKIRCTKDDPRVHMLAQLFRRGALPSMSCVNAPLIDDKRHLFDAMRHSPPRRRRRREREEEAPPEPDRLSALPDALLHRVMSSLKAWEVVRTCMLSRRWRHLWASAPCVDLRLRLGRDDGDDAPEEFTRFVRRLFRHRDASAPVDTLRLRSSDVDGAFDDADAESWIRTAIKRRARVVHLIGHRDGLARLEHADFVSSHLKVLKLSYAFLDGNLLKQLCSGCPSLEEMDLKDCLISGPEISCSSMKTLVMVNCTVSWGLSITALNLLLLRCVRPISRAPSFKNLGSLVSGTIVLDDYCFSDDFEDFSKDEFDETTDDDESNGTRYDRDCYDTNRKRKTAKPLMTSDDDELDGNTDDDEYDETSDDDIDYGKKRKFSTGAGYGFGLTQKSYRPGGYNDNNDYGSDIESDDNTFEYSEIADDCDDPGYDGVGHNTRKDGAQQKQVYGENSGCSDSKDLGGHNVLHCLSNATSLELLADAGEVILTRDLKSCPSFSNLKTLSLGEWCMAADFDALVFFLQHSPNLERLFLELKVNSNTRKPLNIGVKPNGRSFACKHLQMVKIKCSKDDLRVHKLTRLFKANGIPVQKIFVRRTDLRGKKMMKDLARHELAFWGED